MTKLDPVYFVSDGIQWVTERWAAGEGSICVANTHPVYDEDGNPVRVWP